MKVKRKRFESFEALKNLISSNCPRATASPTWSLCTISREAISITTKPLKLHLELKVASVVYCSLRLQLENFRIFFCSSTMRKKENSPALSISSIVSDPPSPQNSKAQTLSTSNDRVEKRGFAACSNLRCDACLMVGKHVLETAIYSCTSCENETTFQLKVREKTIHRLINSFTSCSFRPKHRKTT